MNDKPHTETKPDRDHRGAVREHMKALDNKGWLPRSPKQRAADRLSESKCAQSKKR
jgi:hypothetical protein